MKKFILSVLMLSELVVPGAAWFGIAAPEKPPVTEASFVEFLTGARADINALAERPGIRVFGGGIPIRVNPDAENKIVAASKDIVYASSVDSTEYFATEKNWRLSATGNYVHILLPKPVLLESLASRNGSFWAKEILVPFPDGESPGHILLRNGGIIYSVTKYRPESLCRLVKSASLLSYPPYDQGSLKIFCR